MNKHTSKKFHPCKECDKTISSGIGNVFEWTNYRVGTSSLQRMWQEDQIILSNEKTHTDEKPHPCKECDMNLANV